MTDYRLKVRPYHCDAFGHVNNARYLEFLEEARWLLIESDELNKFLKTHELGMVVVNLNITYKKPALPNEILFVGAEVVQFGNSSFDISQHIKLENDEVVATALVKLVVIQLNTNRPQKITPELKNIFERATKKEI